MTVDLQLLRREAELLRDLNVGEFSETNVRSVAERCIALIEELEAHTPTATNNNGTTGWQWCCGLHQARHTP